MEIPPKTKFEGYIVLAGHAIGILRFTIGAVFALEWRLRAMRWQSVIDRARDKRYGWAKENKWLYKGAEKQKAMAAVTERTRCTKMAQAWEDYAIGNS